MTSYLILFVISDIILCAGIGNFKGDRELKGYMDELYIFNRTLNQVEIQGINNHCKGQRASEIIHLDFENVHGNETEDSSYQGNHGHFAGNVFTGSFFFFFY